MSLTKWEKSNGIACLSMCNGGNTHNLEFSKEMNAVLDEISSDPGVSSLIVTSTDPKNFSLGIDVDWIGKQFQNQEFQNIKDFMYGMNNVFRKLLLFPVPAIAAINGHAFGNGAIISCTFDFRFMRSDRGFFCFPEVDLGIPFLPGMLAIVKKSIPLYKLNEMYYSGRRVGATELAECHMLEKACSGTEELMNDAYEFAARFTKKKGIFSEMKKRMNRQIIQIMESEDPPVIESLKLFITD